MWIVFHVQNPILLVKQLELPFKIIESEFKRFSLIYYLYFVNMGLYGIKLSLVCIK
jgi:hypothetical protein